ncbi:MAG: sigma-70 family RNA polymerase sigma factor [Lachnospiraceae bacterium]|nr:sigma-70 family RNA polymerase sigma factor [Lachnospiraceae bacterium]
MKKEQISVLYEAHYCSLLSFTKSLISNHHDAEDIVQEAFLVCLDYDLTSKNSLKVLYSIIQTIISKRKHADLDYQLATSHNSEEYLSSFQQSSDFKTCIKNAYKRLSPSDQQIIDYSIIQNLNSFEISRILNISPAAARKRLQRSKQRLGEIYNKELCF